MASSHRKFWIGTSARRANPTVRSAIAINKEYLAYMHNWALFPDNVTVPNAWFTNPNHIAEWPMHLGNSYNSPEKHRP